MASTRNKLVMIATRLIVCMVVLAVGIAVVALLVRSRPRPEVSGAGSDGPTVLVMKAELVPVKRQWTGFGTAQAMDSVDVPARVSATVSILPPEIEVGATVTAGQLLMQLDDSDFVRQVEIATQNIADLQARIQQLQIEQESWEARADLSREGVELARAEYDRAEDALSRNVAKQREVDLVRQTLLDAIRSEVGTREELGKLPQRAASLRAQKLGQEASLRLAQQNVDRCRIVSQLNGVLQSVDVEPGEDLRVGQRVARVVNLDRIEVPLRLPSGARATVVVGDQVELQSSGSMSGIWRAAVQRIAPEDDQVTRTMTVFVEVDQGGEIALPLAPGTFVQGTVTSPSTERRWIVPRRSVRGSRLSVVEGGVVTSRVVDVDFHVQDEYPQLGVPDREWVVLNGALPEGALVMLNASRALIDGTRVQPVEIQDAAIASNLDGPMAEPASAESPR